MTSHPLRAALVVIAALLFVSLDHGLPQRYVPDDTTVRCALGIARDLTADDVPLLEALCPPEDRYTTYPMLLPYLDLAAVGVRFAAGLALGEWSGPGSFKAAVFEDPGVAWLPARVVAALLALLVPLGVAGAARQLGRSRGEAALAALAAGSSLLLVQYAHTSRPWAPMLGFAAVTLWLSLRVRRRRRPRDVMAPFAAAALAGSAFQVGLVMLGLPVGAVALALVAPGPRGREGLVRGAVLGLVVAVVLLAAVGYPHVLLHGEGAGTGQGDDAVSADREAAAVSIGGQDFDVSRFAGARAGEMAVAWAATEPLLALTGLLGLLLLGVTCRSGPCWLLVVMPGVSLIALFTLYDGTHVRYLMAATPFLALGSAALLAALARSGRLGAAVAALMLAVPVVQAARLDLLLGRPDTRTLAARDLPALVEEGQRLAVDGLGSRYGPPLAVRAETLRETRDAGVWLGRLEQQVVAFADEGLPPAPEARLAVPVQRFWRFDSYYPTDVLVGGRSVAQRRAAGETLAPDGSPLEPLSFSQWLDDWRIDAYVQVDRLPDPARRAPVTELTARRGRLLASWSPTGADEPVRAELPTDMALPLLDLWTYERPGPWIRLWEITP